MTAIAIVGRACLLPGASSPEALWELVREKRSAVQAVPTTGTGAFANRFATDLETVRGTPSHSVDKTWSTRGGYVTDSVGDFRGEDDVKGLDPLFGWTLSTAHRALRDAGFDDGLVGQDRVRGGFVMGNLSFPTEGMTRLGETLALPDAWRERLGRAAPDPRDRFMSGLPALLVEKHLGLSQFAFALDAACASSLYAIHLGMRALQAGDVDVVVAGATNRADALFLHVGFSALQALSTSGTPRPFDDGADGLVPAEGTAMLTLMRLDDALAQKKTIYGVLRGSALSNDGRSKNLLAPSSEGQVRALAGAWQDAGLDPRSASLFECHATGTPTGDKVEVESIRQLLATSTSPLPLGALRLGSLKGNLGHLITAAGAAGLIKVLEALRHETLPPTIGVRAPIAALKDAPDLALQTDAAPWLSPDGPRRAGVSAFGFGGNDAHVVVEEAPGRHIFASASVEAVVSSTTQATKHKREPLAVVALGSRIGEHASVAQALAAGSGVAKAVVVDGDGVRFPPNDLKESIAQQLLVFEAARDAVATLAPASATDTGSAPELGDILPMNRTGVFVGMGCDLAVTTPGLRWRAPAFAAAAGVDAAHVARLKDLAMPAMGATGVLGCMPNIPANRLNVQFDLRGPGFTLSSEGRSGADALRTAHVLLAAGDIDAAIVAAVDVGSDARHLSAL